MELRFLHDTDKCEVDFVVMRDCKDLFAVECKTGEKTVAPAIFYFKERTDIPHFYQVHLGEVHRQVDDKVSIMPFGDFCKEVGLAQSPAFSS